MDDPMKFCPACPIERTVFRLLRENKSLRNKNKKLEEKLGLLFECREKLWKQLLHYIAC